MRNIFLIVFFLALAFPAAISAQTVPTHKFAGTVTIDGISANGAAVTAFIDGSRVASSKTIQGRYTLSVTQTSRRSFSGKIVSFEVSGNPVKSTAIWKAGGSSELDLSVKTAQRVTPKPEVRPTLYPTSRPKASPESEKTWCSDIKEVFGAPDGNGTIIITLERLPVLQGGFISLTGTNYDGNQTVLREYHYDGFWEYLIKHRWEGASPPPPGDTARACSVTSNPVIDRTPDASPKSPSARDASTESPSSQDASTESPNKPAQNRGFLVNRPIGGIESGVQWNKIDAHSLSIIGIILTLATAAIPLFKGD